MKNGLQFPSSEIYCRLIILMISRGLKSIPPLSARRKQDEIDRAKIEVVYPPSIIQEQKIPTIIQQLATERNDVHRRRLVWSLVGMPIVAPFALVPIIPNVRLS